MIENTTLENILETVDSGSATAAKDQLTFGHERFRDICKNIEKYGLCVGGLDELLNARECVDESFGWRPFAINTSLLSGIDYGEVDSDVNAIRFEQDGTVFILIPRYFAEPTLISIRPDGFDEEQFCISEITENIFFQEEPDMWRIIMHGLYFLTQCSTVISFSAKKELRRAIERITRMEEDCSDNILLMSNNLFDYADDLAGLLQLIKRHTPQDFNY